MVFYRRSFGFRQEGFRRSGRGWRLAFHLSFTKESGVIIMTDFEIISLFIMILMLIVSILDLCKKGK